ncbi:MAG: glycosyltransferase family 4 protein [Candidatus Obscuribacterales bacterium]|nr:glycosyltransferase family 4 protein [Candidatus Obscuribacterales bacterium]
MKLLVYSEVFWPSVGGIESVSRELCQGLTEAGCTVTLVTETELDGKPEINAPYKIFRRLSWRQLFTLAKDCDLVYCNGTYFKSFLLAKLCGKPFVWTHATYRFIFPDGSTWFDSRDRRSILRKLKDAAAKRGPLRLLANMVKLQLRWLAALLSECNVAISQHMALCQKLPNQQVIYNPVQLSNFVAANKQSKNYVFGYVGRLVGEKGVDTLIKAFAQLIKKDRLCGKEEHGKLLIIGGGPAQKHLQELCSQLDVAELVDFCGVQAGSSLSTLISSVEIFVIPSLWEEPMGVVAVELMAAQKPLIVSRRGALPEVTQGNSLSFENEDEAELAMLMERLRADEALRKTFSEKGKLIANQYARENISKQYLALFKSICHKES